MQAPSNLKLERTIGSGTFGKVKRAIHLPTGRPVAVKVLNKHKILGKKDALRIERQITILKRICHPNLLQLLQLVETSKSFMLVTQLVEGEELFHRINRLGKLGEDEAGEYFVQLLDAVLHLRGRGIVHRDVKPENIIIQGGRLTLIDYGLGNLYGEGEKLNTSCGSHCYAAPEMMTGRPYDPEKTEVWALGVTLYAMLSGNLPFEHENPSQLRKLMNQNQYEHIPALPTALQELLRGMVESRPSKRLSLKQVRQHEWVRAMQYEFVEQGGQKEWNSALLEQMQKEFKVGRNELVWRIQQAFGEESIAYYLRSGQATQELPFHSGAVHLGYIFKTLRQAESFVNEEWAGCEWQSTGCAVGGDRAFRVKQIKGGFFYLCVEMI